MTPSSLTGKAMAGRRPVCFARLLRVASAWRVALLSILLAGTGIALLSISFSARESARAALNIQAATPRPAARWVPNAPPPVESLRLRDISPIEARAFNAAIPFSSLPNPAARPFHFAGTISDLARATDCLAAAMWYEAGDDPVGERAVAQVVLNRLRHPAFPKTICGVVFQGSERQAGCQFTFTCDGALARTPSSAAWTRARAIAERALKGAVFGAVGQSTHYHTDWVVPYWSSSLDKVTAVGTHLFFRWKGWWGTPPAFRLSQAGVEPAIPLIARLSPAHAGAVGTMPPPILASAQSARPGFIAAVPMAIGPDMIGARITDSATLAAISPDANAFILLLDRAAAPERYQAAALRLCEGRPRCRVLGWTDAALTPGRFPVEPALLAKMSYSYLSDQAVQLERSLWNCAQFPVMDAGDRCMRNRDPGMAAPETPPKAPTIASADVPEKPRVRQIFEIRDGSAIAIAPTAETGK